MFSTLIIALLALNSIILVLLTILLFKQRRISRNLSTLGKGAAEGKLPYIINQSYNRLTELSTNFENLNKAHSITKNSLDKSLQNIGLIRYPAFDDVGGNLSFSLALLNNQKDGIVFTCINGRNENRLYVKQIIDGVPAEHPLAPEETKAIKKASKISTKKTTKLNPKARVKSKS